MTLNCLITGVGGQGTVLMSRLIGTAAISKGFDVRGCETIGMAQRGGSVVSHVRMGRNIFSPVIPQGKAGLVIAFEPAEAVRVYRFLSSSGRMIVLDRAIMPVSGMLGAKKYKGEEMLAFLRSCLASSPKENSGKAAEDRLTVIETDRLIEQCGNPKVINTALLGVAAGKQLLPFTAGEMITVLKERIPPQYLDINIRAFNAGEELAAQEPSS